MVVLPIIVFMRLAEFDMGSFDMTKQMTPIDLNIVR